MSDFGTVVLFVNQGRSEFAYRVLRCDEDFFPEAQKKVLETVASHFTTFRVEWWPDGERDAELARMPRYPYEI